MPPLEGPLPDYIANWQPREFGGAPEPDEGRPSDDAITAPPVALGSAEVASGLDSLGVSELAGALSTAFGIALEPTFLFDHPTIAAAASAVVAALRAADAAAGADAAVDGWNLLGLERRGRTRVGRR